MPLKEKEGPKTGLWVVIPVKPLMRSKSRLKACLGRRRPELTLAMLNDVLDALRASEVVAGVVVVTLDPEVAERARAAGALVVEEAGPYGMNPAIAQGIRRAIAVGANWLVILPADVPLLTGREFDRLVHEFRTRAAEEPGPVTGIVASADRGGTNWLCQASGSPFTPRYGPASYLRHCEHAERAGRRAITLSSTLVSLDIDEEADLDAFRSFCGTHPEYRMTRTWKFLDGLGQGLPSEHTSGTPPLEESKYACVES